MIDLAALSVTDNHVHPWRATTRWISPDDLAGQVAFSDTVVSSVRREFLPDAELAPALKLFRGSHLGVNYFRSELARFLDVADDWESVTAERNRQAAADYR